jgi:hypothetical protein
LVVKIGPAAPNGRSRLSERDMIVKRRMKLKFVSLSLTLVFAAALATSAAAEDAAPQPSSDAKATSSPTHAPDSLPAGNNSTAPSGGANTEDIDTRITMQPRGPSSGKPGRVGSTTSPIVPLKLINPHRRTFSPSRAANRLPPNASSIPGVQRQNVQQNLGEHFEYKGLIQRPAIAGIHQPLVQSTGISPVGAGTKTMIRGGIGGASLNHHSARSGTAGIGGPAHTVTGINGTSIQAH